MKDFYVVLDSDGNIVRFTDHSPRQLDYDDSVHTFLMSNHDDAVKVVDHLNKNSNGFNSYSSQKAVLTFVD